MRKSFLAFAIIALISGCNSNKNNFDASGTFESNEVIVSAKQAGQILSLNIHEGDKLQKNQLVGAIDVSNIILQKEQIKATITSLQDKLNTSLPQIEVTEKQLAVQQSQRAYLLKDQARIESLIKADAATQQQLDDANSKVDEINHQIAVSKQQILSYKSTTNTQNKSILSEQKPLERSVDEIEDRIGKGRIINPVSGTVLMQYSYEGEMASVGKALYKIADVDTIYLRAYINGVQLPKIKLGQEVKVRIDDGSKFKEYKGSITWVSGKAEFTPKTIQTKDERQNLVYAIKIRVANDGYIKIGMYGEVNF